jgi:UDP-glucose 4-epimerase
MSKLSAERGLADLDLDWVALRAVLVYGRGVKGNMAQLMRLARSPIPLPVASLKARRSLLALENLSTAIEAVLAVPGPLRRVLIVADPQPLTVAEMIAAMRGGLGRRANVFPLPPRLLEILLRAAGQGEIYCRIFRLAGGRSLGPDRSGLGTAGDNTSRTLKTHAARRRSKQLNELDVAGDADNHRRTALQSTCIPQRAAVGTFQFSLRCGRTEMVHDSDSQCPGHLGEMRRIVGIKP